MQQRRIEYRTRVPVILEVTPAVMWTRTNRRRMQLRCVHSWRVVLSLRVALRVCHSSIISGSGGAVQFRHVFTRMMWRLQPFPVERMFNRWRGAIEPGVNAVSKRAEVGGRRTRL